ncbi:MAG: hypothetical protein WAT39_26035, partial [Planctomycetota bacterium]
TLLAVPAEALARRDELATIVAALTARTPPRWTAPLPTDPDKGAWLELLAAFCASEEALELREPALAMAPMLDAREQRVPEVFPLLAGIVRDASAATKLRATAAIHLQGWRTEATFAEPWLQVQHALLQDPIAALRRQAAESLAGLTESVAERRGDWLGATILVLRDRLLAEVDPEVLRAMVDCLQTIGREPSMPERAIGALRFVLDELGSPVPPDHQFRLEPLLSALATIGADPRADRGQWLAACPPLLANKRRQGLRLILQSHAAIDLAKDVASTEASLATRARQAMHCLIDAALQKPAREAWSSSPELQREARDVRTAFGALDALEEAQRLERAPHRLLRLEVELATGKAQDVVQRAGAWLANGVGVGVSDDERNRMRALVAEAHLVLGRPDAARKAWEERTGDGLTDAASLDLETRIGRALVPTDIAGAVEVLGRVYRRTAVDDPGFRPRLVEWMQLRIRLDPALRADTVREGSVHAGLFQAADCPAELRDTFEQLLGSR